MQTVSEQEVRLFSELFELLDSNNPGECAAALDRIGALRTKMTFPAFVELLATVGRDVTSHAKAAE